MRRAGIYAPGGQAPYPSSIVMGVATARAAGVPEVVVCAAHPLMQAPARCAAPTRSTRWAAPRRSPRSPTAPSPCAGRRHRRARGTCTSQEAKRQVFGARRHRRLRRPERPRRRSRRAAPTRAPWRSTRSARPSTGPDSVVAVASPDPAVLDGASRRPRTTALLALIASRPGDGAGVHRGVRARAPAAVRRAAPRRSRRA